MDGWLNAVVDLGVIVVLLLRGLAERREQPAWLSLTAGLAAAFAGSVAYYTHYQHLQPVPTRSWADLGWLAFYPLLYVGLLLLLRARVRRLLPSLWLDGLVAG
ncbi:MAG: GGDEF-domain containing protein, partial [Actinomycetota bacterium]|nr:GGDEF-domain containing protein [Actinomycetota bacterium]